MKIVYWITVYLFKFLFFVFYRHRVYGLENVPKGAAILAPNHVSYYDPLLVAGSLPEEVFFLAKESLFDSWIMGPLLRSLNTYPVSGSASDLASFKILCKLLKEGKKVSVFPEGVRTSDGELQPLQLGVAMLAIRCQCPIIPTYIQGVYEVYPRQKKYPKPFGKISCTFGKPIYPETYAAMDKKSAQAAMTEDLTKALKEQSRLSAKGESS